MKKSGNSDEKEYQSKKTRQWLAMQMSYLGQNYISIAMPFVGLKKKIDSFPLLSKKSPM